jgi:2-methylcitrate dehydratase
VFAVRLARAGLTGPAPIFEGKFGMFQQVTGAADIDVASFGDRSRYRAIQGGVPAGIRLGG